MTGEGEGREREPDRADFGPPTGDFGPPVSGFGPPTGEVPEPGWKPTPRPEDSGLTWRPAGGSGASAPEPPPVPPPPPQYRAPGSSIPVQVPAPADSRPVARPTVGASDPDSTTVRHQIPPEPIARNTAGRAPESDQATVRHQTGPDLRWPSPNQSNQPDQSGGSDPAAGSARPRPGGLSWDSDPIAQKLTPQSVAGALSTKPRRRPPVGRIVTGVAVLVALVAVGVAIVEVSGGDDEPSTPATADSALSCPASEESGVIVGDGVGDTTSGAGAILGFQHQFYVERDGIGARQFVAVDSPAISSAETIQDAIDMHIPAGTAHCVRITERAPASFDVDLTELQPDGKKTVYKQTVTTVDRDGKTVLWVIADRR
ncbi:hypothetical protein [Nocardia sp. NBC_01329]|uniref:hypothetical protein n=1 Tax=Nocardia sp. NBC_01329 TaxID=2903594 RepID=UPI002E127612|nr:hypothetical protein OG405_21630 [Nocardia sp. NBC_01329]